jgi:hypothetical protein
MRKKFKGVLMLLVFTIALAFMPVPQAMADETFSYKSPDFTLTIPSWDKFKSDNPNSVLRRVADQGTQLPGIEVTVYNQTEGKTFKDSAKALIEVLEDKFNATDCKTLYEREIKLQDGTPAYELEVQWKHPMVLLYTYQVIAAKDKKVVIVGVTSFSQIDDKLKQYPLSLTLK